LQGLRAGTASAEQVLEIGRRLYASSQAYTDLFNMVQSLSRGGAIGGGSSGAIRGVSGGGLTGEERKRLSDLLKEQDQLQAAAQLQQYQTLAQQIAEIASAKGEDWQEVLKEMGINIADFEKGLGLNDEQTQKYIDSIQTQTDSNGENTRSIVDAINAMSDAVVRALGGTPDATHGDTTSLTGSHGHSGHSRPGDTESGATAPLPGSFGHSGHMLPEEVGERMARGFERGTLASQPRSMRPAVPA
jgi:hypothetical protein